MSDWRCFFCNSEITESEIEKWQRETPTCCSGRDCGCMGLPIDPPICDKCYEQSWCADEECEQE